MSNHLFEAAQIDNLYFHAFREAFEAHALVEGERQLRETGQVDPQYQEAMSLKTFGGHVARTAADVGLTMGVGSAIEHISNKMSQPKPPKPSKEPKQIPLQDGAQETELQEDDLNFEQPSDPEPAAPPATSANKDNVPEGGKETKTEKKTAGPTFNTGPQAQGGNNPVPILRPGAGNGTPGSATVNWSKKEAIQESIFQSNLTLIQESIADPEKSEISVLHSIVEVLNHLGNTYFTANTKRDPVEVGLLEKLSPRESEILKLVIGGTANKVIASDVGISENTVRNHIANIFKKLHVQNRTQAANLITKQANKPSDKVFVHVLRTVIDRLQQFKHPELNNAIDLIMQNKLLQAKAQVMQVLDGAEKAFLANEKAASKPVILDKLAHRLGKQAGYRATAKKKRQDDALLRNILTGKSSVSSAKKTVSEPWRRDKEFGGLDGPGGKIDEEVVDKWKTKKQESVIDIYDSLMEGDEQPHDPEWKGHLKKAAAITGAALVAGVLHHKLNSRIPSRTPSVVPHVATPTPTPAKIKIKASAPVSTPKPASTPKPTYVHNPDNHPRYEGIRKTLIEKHGIDMDNMHESEFTADLLESIKSSTEVQEHQKRVADKLEHSGGVLAFHGMGSGKSLTAINATQGQHPDVVVPASLRNNYQKEIDKHTKPGTHSANIMSYEKAVKDAQPHSKFLVMDEPQAIGHADTERSKKLLDKAQGYEHRLLLTGTPIRNHPHELAPLINVVRGDNALPLDRKAFEQKYVKDVMSKPSFLGRVIGVEPQVVGHEIKNKAELEKLLKGHVDYHMPGKDNFPSSHEELIKVQMSPAQQKMYDFAAKKMNPLLAYKVRKGLPISKQDSADLNAFMSATRQISNTAGAYGENGSSPKLERAVQELKQRHDKDPNFRGLVYSNYLDSGIRPYAKELDKHGISYHIFDGSMSDKQREHVVNEYNTGKVKNLLISGAGAQGLDLKGTKLVQILEPHWNSARTEQAKARAIRFKSHDHLPENERHVEVQSFHSTLRPYRAGSIIKAANFLNPMTAPQRSYQYMLDKIYKTEKKPDQSADEYLHNMNKEKDALNNKFLDVLKDVGSRRESVIEIYESAMDDKTKSYQDNKKDLEDQVWAKKIRQHVKGAAIMTIPGAVYGGIAHANFGTPLGKSLAVGGVIGAGLGALLAKNDKTLGDYSKEQNTIKQMNADHKVLTGLYEQLKNHIHREPTHEEIDHIWDEWEKEQIRLKLEKTKAREEGRRMKNRERFSS